MVGDPGKGAAYPEIDGNAGRVRLALAIGALICQRTIKRRGLQDAA
jgi:hypothetical protein